MQSITYTVKIEETYLLKKVSYSTYRDWLNANKDKYMIVDTKELETPITLDYIIEVDQK